MPVSVLFDGWYGARHCHAALTLFVPICLCAIAGFSIKDVSHCTAADSLTMTTCRVVSMSQYVLSQKTDLLHPSGSYQKDGIGALSSGEFVECAEV
jgi:hypothetical protein